MPPNLPGHTAQPRLSVNHAAKPAGAARRISGVGIRRGSAQRGRSQPGPGRIRGIRRRASPRADSGFPRRGRQIRATAKKRQAAIQCRRAAGSGAGPRRAWCSGWLEGASVHCQRQGRKRCRRPIPRFPRHARKERQRTKHRPSSAAFLQRINARSGSTRR